MIISMHCQPSYSRDFSSCCPSSYFLLSPACSTPLFSSYSHPNGTASILTPRRRRRLEDPIVTYASNYYATYPSGMAAASVTPSAPSARPIEREIERKVLYCDLYNLLELPETTSSHPLKARRRTHFNEANPARRHHRLKDLENERKRSIYHREKKHADEIKEKALKNNEIYARRPAAPAAAKGFFRRVMKQYFCLPASMANNGYSS